MKRGRVLVVDDELQVARAMCRMLRDHDTDTESTATAALERLRGGATYDVIFCDLMMPQMSGMDLFRELARIRPDQSERVVFMTGGVVDPTVRAFLDEAANATIEKPFDGPTLRKLVDERLR